MATLDHPAPDPPALLAEAEGAAVPGTRAGEHFFEISGLRRSFGKQTTLDGVDLNIRRGECLVILGRSGEGKSVLLKHLTGLLTPDEGSIIVDGEEIVGVPERKLNKIRQKIGILFQDGALFDSFTVAENVAFPLMERGERRRKVLEERAREVLELVELGEHMEKMPVNISGGMRKRVALARAIITNPSCILYDEPTSGLDPVVSDSIDHLIVNMKNRYRATSVVVTHDMKSMFHIADRVAYLREGRIYFLGTPDELRRCDDPFVNNFIEGRSEATLKAMEREAAAKH